MFVDKIIPYKYKKWTTLMGGFLIHLSLGSYYTFGNISQYLTSYLREYDFLDVRYSKSTLILTAWGLSFSISSIISGLLNSTLKINLKITILIGCIIMNLGVVLTYYTIKMSFFLTLITYGILFGIGCGFAYLGPLSMAMKWFSQKSGFSNSVILFGYGASSIIFDQIQTIYINPDNYSPDKAYSSDHPDEKYFSRLHLDLLERIPNIFLIMAGIFTALQIIGIALLSEFNEKDINMTINEDRITILNEDENLNEKNSLGVRFNSPNDGLTPLQALKNPVFYILTIIISTVTISPTFVVTFYKTFGQTYINDDKFLALVGSVSNFFNAIGRIFWGLMIDRLPFKMCMLILSSCIVALSSTLYLTKFLGIKELYILWISAIMFCQCGIFVLMATVTAKCFGQKNFTAIYALIFLVGIPSSILTAVLSTQSDLFGWFWFFMIGSFLTLIGWFLCLVFNVKKSNGADI
ncbi:unnamed protein product [Brachionus calyciflorus]|uniref:Oxalate:formate antiporter n=1 Tax=Brachionus calyciflorus TaxID=104777 RepID=A0A814C7E9_9BILA|nr:unnamed protein product [Brachionus calyciflorus]